MASLTQRAIDKLSIKDIWEKGVLNASLPPQTFDKLYNKITLQNLYNENLLTSDMDLDLFALALSKSAPNLLWSYIGLMYDTPWNDWVGHFPEHTPFNQEGEEYIIKRYETTLEDYKEILKTALQALLNDLILFLLNLGIPHNYEKRFVVVSELENRQWKLLIIVPDVRYNVLGNYSYTHVFILDSLDEVLSTIYMNISRLIEEGYIVPLYEPKEDTLYTLDPVFLKSLDMIRSGVNLNTEELWEELIMKEIILQNDFALSIRELKRNTRINVMGDYLYLIMVLEDETTFVSFKREEGLLILTGFYIPDNKWSFNDIYIGATEEPVLSR